MASGIFYLDEDRDKEPSPNSSPSCSPSPQLADTPPPSIHPASQTTGQADDCAATAGIQVEPISVHAPGRAASSGRGATEPAILRIPLYTAEPTTTTTAVSITSSNLTAPAPVSFPVPQSGSSLLSQSQAFGRKSGVFAATPSFPSPLAQAITVPSHSDTSSSSSHSSHNSDDEILLETGSQKDGAESTPHKPRPISSPGDNVTVSSRRSSRTPSPAQARQPVPAGTSFTNRAKRSGSGSMLSGPSVTSPPRHGQDSKSVDHGRGLSSAETFGSRGSTAQKNSSGLDPIIGKSDDDPSGSIVSPRPISALSPSLSRDRDANLLGLGYWDVSSTAKGGKVKDTFRSPSPRKEASSPIPMSSSRQRRPSEFLRPSSIDLRKMPPPSVPLGRANVGPPTLSTSASMVSPLNPLPSPWSEVPGGQPAMAGEVSSPSGPSGAIRLTRVPASVRLAADLIKSASQTPPLQSADTPSSTASVPTPKPSPVEDDEPGRNVPKSVLGPSVSLPPGALATAPGPRWRDKTNSSASSPENYAHVPSLSPSLSLSSDPASVSTDPISVPPGHSRTRSSGYWSPSSFRASPRSIGATSSVTDESIGAHEGQNTVLNTVPIPSRLRSVSQKGGLAMDLAGVSSAIGDAASHASMIIQSRQAKVQRWRPDSVLSDGVPPLRYKSIATPSRLSASFVGESDHFAPWVKDGDSASPARENLPAHLNEGGVAMEKQASATGAIAGIEWIDWYDCYKAYKAEKIRAEAKVKAEEQQILTQSAPTSITHSPVKDNELPKRETLPPCATEGSSLTPVTSREEGSSSHQSLSFRRRSLSIRSGISVLDPKATSLQKRTSMHDRPRQSSGGSNLSSSDTHHAAAKRKRNLVTKMEGWWTSVKSNFTAEPSAMASRNSSLYAQPRVPSAPSSRRSSDKHPTLGPSLMPPAPARRASSSSAHSLQTTPQHELDNPVRAISPLPSATQPSPQPQVITAPPVALSRSGDVAVVQRRVPSRPGLEVRRNQPSLKLDLEPHVLSVQNQPVPRHASSNAQSQASGSHSGSSHQPKPYESSRSSSYGFGSNFGFDSKSGQWDPTASPTLSMSGAPRGDRPVAPGAHLTVASVREHVKQRLNAAKEQCDTTLRRVIDIITAFEDQRIAATEYEETRRDYFDAFTDSPVIDAVDSEDDGAIPPFGGLSSRGPSRRGSISLSSSAVISSPSRRVAMLSSMPSSPRRSMSRRRPSINPRALPRDTLPPRTLGVDINHSASSSRSTSRSHSPMPFHRSVASQLFDDTADGDRQFLSALQELIVLATDMVDMTVNSLIARPSVCRDAIQKVQRTGQAWDDHDNWPGRDWYVDILMAVASLARVLDWWEAEKGFWNFDEDDAEDEPLTYILRPAREFSGDDHDPTSARAQGSTAASPLVLPVADISMSTATITIPSLDKTTSAIVSRPPSSAERSRPPTVPPETTQAIEDLRSLAEQAKSINIVMELSLQGEEILYVNDAIFEVIGREPDDVLDRPISELLAPADTSHFTEATENLLEDDNNAVELRFRFEVHDINEDDDERQPGPVYIELEGVGLLIREDDVPSHTMWVMKPVTATQVDTITDAVFPRDGVISTEGVLCRICEREIVVWFFEKHNETCDAVHRLEAEITAIDDCLNDLKRTVDTLKAELRGLHPAETQTLLFFDLPVSLSSSPLFSGDPQAIEVRKVVMAHLEEARNILATALQIETPSVLDDEADLPFNFQRYLSRESEDNVARITRWQKPPTQDRALAVVFSLIEEQLRGKQKATARMQSTIRYSEKTRHEWEDKVNQMVEDSDNASGSDAGSEPAQSSKLDTAAGLPPSDGSPPEPRKIAPLARLPITQGHPQRSWQRDETPSVPDTSASAEFASNQANVPARNTEDPADEFTLAKEMELLNVSTRERDPKGSAAPTSIELHSRSLTSSPLLEGRDRSETRGGHSRRVSTNKAVRDPPLSPRIPSAATASRAPQPSIKDFEIIKPISRGAFGSVFLAKKVATGDYYAIKALKKSDMIAKNQVTNVKAERTILMNQASSPYVAKLFFSFQSKDYLYLVMEYLNGGDCSTLVKALGGLPVDWARNYIGELVLGLEYLHARNVAHRDIKPDNLLIDSRGHLKLTDFGLSKIGLLNRQIGGPRAPYLKGASLRSSAAPRRGSSVSSTDSSAMSPELIPLSVSTTLGQSYFPLPDNGSTDESSGSESMGHVPRHLRSSSKQPSDTGTRSNSGAEAPRFVGTPDYLSPESILGGSSDDRMADWWAVGVVLYEFLYGYPPFNAESPEKVFDNIISRRINWHQDEIEIPAEAQDLMDRLMTTNPATRLGAQGADEVKHHAFFAGINWQTLTTGPALFVPDSTDPESTDYFDPRGAKTSAFVDDEPAPSKVLQSIAADPTSADIDGVVGPSADDFGTFNFKNLPVLKQANDDVIRRIRSDSVAANHVDAQPRERRRKHAKSISRINGPPSPSTSTSSAASTPSRLASSPTISAMFPASLQHSRKASDSNALDRVRSSDDDGGQPTMQGRARVGSISSMLRQSSTWEEPTQGKRQGPEDGSVLSSWAGQALNVLIAEDNPISQKVLETLLQRMGCQCVCVADGPGALAAAMGSIKYDVIFCDILMPFVGGEQVARMIRSTSNPNQDTPIIAATSFDQSVTEQGTLFSAVLPKPFNKIELLNCLAKVGFVLSCPMPGTEMSATQPT